MCEVKPDFAEIAVILEVGWIESDGHKIILVHCLDIGTSVVKCNNLDVVRSLVDARSTSFKKK